MTEIASFASLYSVNENEKVFYILEKKETVCVAGAALYLTGAGAAPFLLEPETNLVD